MFCKSDIQKLCLIAILTTRICLVKSFAISAENFTSNDDINWQTILNIAKHTEDSKLELIGHAIKNMECKFPSCTKWSAWTSCIHISGQFGIKNRTRNCAPTVEKCPYSAENDRMLDQQICKFFMCPAKYKVTEKGYCMQLFTDRNSWHNSQALCERDGGSLAIIDSSEKQADINKTFQITGTPIWMDGIRSNSNAAWTYRSNSSAVTRYSNWAPGEPNDVGQCCKAFNKIATGIWWQDRQCSDPVFYLCEIKD